MIVETRYGKIEGISENGCEVFRGVPYAKPPIGELRFRKPQKPESWEGVYDARTFKNRSMQGAARPGFYKKEFYNNPAFETPMSEDCLYLNIWVPEGVNKTKLPVAVYVHGGAFLGGAGSNLPFVCDRLAQSGVIVVTINYRLGALGFLCHPLIGVAGENEAGGNYGLWDQLCAFDWVKENVEAFGGDCNNVTAFGQSAGAMSLQALALSEKSDGAFEKMILQSGGGYRNPLAEYRTIEQASDFAEDLLEALGLERGAWKESAEKREQAVRLLRETTTGVMMEAVDRMIGKAFQEHKGMPFVPVVDGELLKLDGNRLIAKKQFKKMPYILGANKHDITTENQENPSRGNNLLHIANVGYANLANEEEGSPAYVYYFERNLPGDDAGAFHSAELWYVFGSLEYSWRPFERSDYMLSEEMIAYWSSFMKNGNPNSFGNVEKQRDLWEPCSRENPFVKVFDIEG